MACKSSLYRITRRALDRRPERTHIHRRGTRVSHADIIEISASTSTILRRQDPILSLQHCVRDLQRTLEERAESRRALSSLRLFLRWCQVGRPWRGRRGRTHPGSSRWRSEELVCPVRVRRCRPNRFPRNGARGLRSSPFCCFSCCRGGSCFLLFSLSPCSLGGLLFLFLPLTLGYEVFRLLYLIVSPFIAHGLWIPEVENNPLRASSMLDAYFWLESTSHAEIEVVAIAASKMRFNVGFDIVFAAVTTTELLSDELLPEVVAWNCSLVPGKVHLMRMVCDTLLETIGANTELACPA